MESLLSGILLATCVGLAQCEERKGVFSNVVNFFTREKCIDGLGCFSAWAPFFNFRERPLSLLPDDRQDIDTNFMLYTREHSSTPMVFSNMNSSMDNLSRSGFNPSIKTKFIVHGFFSKMAPDWKMPLKDAFLQFEPCNVFYVDWSARDGPFYAQAVANTRVVGAEIALFIANLQNWTDIKPQSIHIVGHSLGAHAAGYAGKRTPSLGRITGMDPAGPYFTNVDPVVRLDRTDALFVDAIHTNAALSRFKGFGLTESIAHFDFFPNGGHIQPGCKDTLSAIWDFLKNFKFDAEGRKELLCNHVRAIEYFTSSLVHPHCPLVGVQSSSWDHFLEGKRGPIEVPMGVHAIHSADKVLEGESVNFYLTTKDSAPFC